MKSEFLSVLVFRIFVFCSIFSINTYAAPLGTGEVSRVSPAPTLSVAAFVGSSEDPDLDSDSMPDQWEIDIFGDVITADRANLPSDFDADGIPDYLEYYSGTDPTDANSRLKITNVHGFNLNGEFVIEWASSTETWDGLLPDSRSYKIFRADSVTELLSIDDFDAVPSPSGSPAFLGEVQANPTGEVTTFTDTEDSSGVEKRFYQVILSAPLPD